MRRTIEYVFVNDYDFAQKNTPPFLSNPYVTWQIVIGRSTPNAAGQIVAFAAPKAVSLQDRLGTIESGRVCSESQTGSSQGNA